MYIEGLWDTVKTWADAHETELQRLHSFCPDQPVDEMVRDILNRGLREETAIAEEMMEGDEDDRVTQRTH